MKLFEYKFVKLNPSGDPCTPSVLEEEANKFGLEGWRMVSINFSSSPLAVFERPLSKGPSLLTEKV